MKETIPHCNLSDDVDAGIISQAVAEYAKQKGYRLLGRLQIDLYGDKRGR